MGGRAGFCVTGAEDRFVRVWPLDFSDYFLEAEHAAPVSAVSVSHDCLKIAIGPAPHLMPPTSP